MLQNRRLLTFLILPLLLAACGRRQAPPGPPGAAPSRPAAASAPVPARPEASAPLPQPQPKDERPVILALGDSLTAGLGVPAQDSYPARLEAALAARGLRFRVVNAGVSGDTTAGGLQRLPGLLAEHRPRVVIVELGANDGLRGLPVAEVRRNLSAIIQRCQAAGAQVVLAGMQLPPSYGEAYARQFAAVFPDLAREHQVALIPFFLDGVAGRPELNLPDGIHPTGAGYGLVTENVLRVLLPLIQ